MTCYPSKAYFARRAWAIRQQELARKSYANLTARESPLLGSVEDEQAEINEWILQLAELSLASETPGVHADKLMDALIMLCRRIVRERDIK